MIRSMWFPLMWACLLFIIVYALISNIEQTGNVIVTTGAAGFFFIGSTVFCLDAIARVRTYWKYKQPKFNVNSLRVILNLRMSFCSRQVGIALYGDIAEDIYRESGYRWYHLFPDGVFRRDTVLLRAAFWRSVLKGV